MARAPVSVDRVSFDAEKERVIVFKKPKGNKGKRPNESVSYSVPEFLALVMSHIPSPYEGNVIKLNSNTAYNGQTCHPE